MKIFKCIGIPLAVLLLASCSYFDTEETIEVTSEGLEESAPIIDEHSVENIIYQKTEGSVEIYNLDMSEEDAVNVFAPLDAPEAESTNGLVMNPSVEIYPIDVPMQRTLKP